MKTNTYNPLQLRTRILSLKNSINRSKPDIHPSQMKTKIEPPGTTIAISSRQYRSHGAHAKKYLLPLLVAVFVVLAALTAHAQSPPQYSIIDLGTLDGNSDTFALAINDSGQVTGYGGDATLGSSSIAFIYSGGVMQSLGTLGGDFSAGNAINNSGQITGNSAVAPNGDAHAFLWSNGAMQDLGTLGGSGSIGFGLNDAGQVVGYSTDGQLNFVQAFLYRDGVMTNLGLSSNGQSFANAINNAGQITGALVAGGQNHAFLYSNGTAQDLGTLGGHLSVGKGINSSAQIGGFSTLPSNNRHAFLYSNGIMQDLGTLSGGAFDESFGCGINGAGQVVGNSDNSQGVRVGFLYTGGVMYELNNLVPSNSGVTSIKVGFGGSGAGNAINNFGQIAASGVVDNIHALILSPVPASEATPVPANTSYTSVPPLTNSNTPNATTVSLLDGTASTGGTVQISFSIGLPPGSSSFAAASDIVNISGTGTDVFVLQVSYNEALAISTFGSEDNARLMWFDPSDSQWKLAVAGNIGTVNQQFINRAYDPATDFQLGNHGIDTVNNVVWAVINHNSAFAVGKLPPISFAATVQQPINANGTSVFTVRRGVVPVKFTLTQNGTSTCTLPPATIAVTRTAGGVIGSVNESIYSGSADNGSNFRIEGCQYAYNLNSSALGVGTYRLDIKINGTVVGSATFELK